VPGLSPNRNVWSAALLQAKNEDGDMVCASVSGLFVSKLLLARDGMRCALVLIDYPVYDDLFRLSGFKSAGFDRFAIS
jgi:hypothetical protein